MPARLAFPHSLGFTLLLLPWLEPISSFAREREQVCLTKGEQRRTEMPQNTAAFPQPLSCVYRASTYMTCGSVYALPCLALPCLALLRVRARNNYSMCSHPAAHAPAAADSSSTTALSHARDLFARASTLLLLTSVRVAGTADRLTETGGRILPGKQAKQREARGHGSWASLSLSFPTGRPGAGSLRRPLALGRRSGVSAKTSREGVF